MTPEAQRIAIAEACGYTNVHKDRHGYMVGEGKIDHYGVPDYLNDLNAMHEAEKQLMTADIWPHYLEYLRDCCLMFTHRATAAQRAEAFLKTLGLWK